MVLRCDGDGGIIWCVWCDLCECLDVGMVFMCGVVDDIVCVDGCCFVLLLLCFMVLRYLLLGVSWRVIRLFGCVFGGVFISVIDIWRCFWVGWWCLFVWFFCCWGLIWVVFCCGVVICVCVGKLCCMSMFCLCKFGVV